MATQSAVFVGNLAADPVLRSSGTGTPRATFSIAVNEGDKDKGTEKTHWVDFTAFGTLAENVVASLKKGQRIIVQGRLDTYDKAVTIAGEEKNIKMTSFKADAVGPDLRWQQAQVSKVSSGASAAPAAAAPVAAGVGNSDF